MKKLVPLLLITTVLLITALSAPNNYLVLSAPEPDLPTKFFLDNGDYVEQQKWREECALKYKRYQEDVLSKKTNMSNIPGFYSVFSDAYMTNSYGENCYLSPVDLYMTLGIAAKCNAVNKNNILNILGVTDISTVQTQSDYMWSALYENTEINKCSFHTSLWLNKNTIKAEIDSKSIANRFHASVYAGDYGKKMNVEASKWVNAATNGNLSLQSNNYLDNKWDATILTVFDFNKKWKNKFKKDLEGPKPFYLADHTTVNCDYMNQISFSSVYIEPGIFTAVSVPFENYSISPSGYHSVSALFLLPDETITVEDMLASPLTQKFLCSFSESTESPFEKCEGYYHLTLSVPMIDLQTNTDLTNGFCTLGLTPTGHTIQATNSTHIRMNEEGCLATSLTQLNILVLSGGRVNSLGDLSLTLNRPYAFAIVSKTGDIPMPILVGKINNPAQ